MVKLNTNYTFFRLTKKNLLIQSPASYGSLEKSYKSCNENHSGDDVTSRWIILCHT